MRPRSKLALARVGRGLTQFEAARAIGVSQATVSLWEIGHRRPGPNQRRALADLLGAPEGDIFDPDAIAQGSP